MTTTVTSPSTDSASFEAAFGREVLQSERLRIVVVVALFGAIYLRWAFIWLVFPQAIEAQMGAALHIALLGSLGAAIIGYELLVLLRLTYALRRGKTVPKVMRYLNAFVEISFPTAAMIFGVEVSSPAYALFAPPAWAYFVFIILATLRLDFWLCLFTGLTAAAQYGILGLVLLSQPQVETVDPILSAQMNHGMRIGLLLGAGLAAGIVSLQIKRQFVRALRSVEEQNRVIGMFGQHVSPAVVERLLTQDVEIGGEVRHVCVMFLDIQGFTTFSENKRPEEVVAYLNSLFPVLIDSVNGHQGIVNKFLGDGFMAVFGAPIEDAQDCRNAVAAALEMLHAVETMSMRGTIAPTTIRIGLHAGEAVTGNVGSSARKEYTIIGDVVNLASRLEQLNKQFGSRLLVSEMVADRLDGIAVTKIGHGDVQVKGREQPVPVFELRDEQPAASTG
ncbi:MAG: adenylate/guanylate cyclase domain-containing protein [Chloroflexi bacterium]|nr:adenylate/guanylate cyclase domain-containing protein [Chloroflexota bacterium]